jgi:hypothetical protein
MSDIEILLEWPVAADYRIERQRFGPRTLAQGGRSGNRGGGRVVLVPSGPQIKQCPFNRPGSRPLFLHLVQNKNKAPLGDIVLKFAKAFGQLGSNQQPEPLRLWQELITDLRRLLNWGTFWNKERRRLEELGVAPASGLITIKTGALLQLELRPNPLDGRPMMVFSPPTLTAALRLECAITLLDSEIKPCKKCGGLFVTGERGKKANAQFCSRACNDNFHNREKLKRCRI